MPLENAKIELVQELRYLFMSMVALILVFYVLCTCIGAILLACVWILEMHLGVNHACLRTLPAY